MIGFHRLSRKAVWFTAAGIALSTCGATLVGQTFLEHWGNKPLSDLYDFEHQNMPATNPGSVPANQLWNITAYILQKNGFAAGTIPVQHVTR
jgi:hypothetical protein